MKKVQTAKELGEALKNDEPTIEISGNLADQTFKIRATGSVAWVIAYGLLAGGVAAALLAARTRKPAIGGAALLAAPAAMAILGPAATGMAIAIATEAGSATALTNLRKYKELKRGPGILILEKA